MTALATLLHLVALVAIPLGFMGVGAAINVQNTRTGTGFMGNFGSLGVGGNIRDFKAAPDGLIKTIMWTIQIQVKNTAGIGSLVVGGLARGVDDMDILMGSVMSGVSARLDTSSQLFQNVTFPQLRNQIQALTLRDLGGNFLNGAALPSSFFTYTIEIPIPLAVPARFDDGGTLAQGATRVRLGQMFVNCSQTSASGVALTNYTASWQGLNMWLTAYGSPGDNNTIAKSWTAEWVQNLDTALVRFAATRILLADQTPAITNTASEQAYTIDAQESLDLVGPQFLHQRYLSEVTPIGGYDIGVSLTPLVNMPLHAQVSSLPAPVNASVRFPTAPGGVVNILDIYLVDPPGQTVATVATAAAGSSSGAVAESHPASRSLPTGSAIPPQAVGNLPSVLQSPAAAAAAGTPSVTHASPAAAASNMGKRTLLASAVSKVFRR